MTPEDYINNVIKTESVDFPAIYKRMMDTQKLRLLHGAMGLETEVGELMDALKKHIFYGKKLDLVNIMEECGDICWYLGIILHALGYTWAEVWKRNIEKLKARYGDKFTETRAENRDLEKEREILEGDDDN